MGNKTRILIPISVILFVLTLIGCSQKPPVCNPTDVCKNFNDCGQCSVVQMGYVKTEDVNSLINLTDSLIAYYNLHENASVQYLPFYKLPEGR